MFACPSEPGRDSVVFVTRLSITHETNIFDRKWPIPMGQSGLNQYGLSRIRKDSNCTFSNCVGLGSVWDCRVDRD